MHRVLRTALWLAPAFLAVAVLYWIGAPAASVPLEPTIAEAEEPLPPEPELLPAPPPFQPVLLGLAPTPEVRIPEGNPEWVPRVPKRDLAALGRIKAWTASVRAFYGLPEAVSDEAALARLQGLFTEVEEPVVRQNLIFLAALGLPDVAGPWLQELASGTEAEAIYAPDREDALVALAFAGEGTYAASFEGLSLQASSAHVQRLVDRIDDHDAIGASGGLDARETLRAYRAIEVLDRAPYFKMLAHYAPLDWQSRRAASTDVAATERLLKAWLARYPGHPGSDDIARRLARAAIKAGRPVEAARWFSRSATLPDQDVAWGALWGLISTCELMLTPAQLDRLANEEGDLTPNRQLMMYIRARRLAARVGFAAGLDALDDMRRFESPHEPLVRGWAKRWTTPPARGLTSGVVPLDPTDELLQRGELAFELPPRPSRVQRSWDVRRLDPDLEPKVLPVGRLARQFRLWETLAELEERAQGAHGDARADLLYKQAAVFYHQPDVLFPAYAWHSHSFVWLMGRAELEIVESTHAQARAHRHFQTETFSLRRAVALFERIEREHPGYVAMDRVLFSKGLAWKHLADYRPNRAWFALPEHATLSSTDLALRNVVTTFETLVARYPDSTYADDAARAVGHWRATLPQLFSRR